jgi:hypothetical protein
MNTKWLKATDQMEKLPYSETDQNINYWLWKLEESYASFDQLTNDLTLLLSDPDSAPRVTRLLQAIEEMQNEEEA